MVVRKCTRETFSSSFLFLYIIKYFDAGAVNLLGELVDSNVARRAHQDLPLALLDQVVDNRGRGHRLARARRALDQAQRLLDHRLDGVNLRMVQFRQSRH